MTTYYPFTPSAVAPFNFQPTLDGVVYNITVPWSLFGQRYYVNCYTQNGNLVFSVPLIGSVDGIHIQDVSWANGYVTVTLDEAHNFRVGATVKLTITGMTPAAYNGTFECMATSRNQFTYPLMADPGTESALGYAQYDVNIAAGYFTSTLVFRESNQTFEVSP